MKNTVFHVFSAKLAFACLIRVGLFQATPSFLKSGVKIIGTDVASIYSRANMKAF